MPQVPSVLQTAFMALGGTGQGLHWVPHELTLELSAHRPLQSCVPVGQTPLHDMLEGMQAPTHSFWLVGHMPPQLVPSQVAVPPTGAVQGVQDMLQVSALLLLTQATPQMW